MPRHPRREMAGAVHHVVSKTPSGRILFYDDADRERYLRLIAREVGERGWRLLTYCLMTNHTHLLVVTPEPDLGAGFKRINEDFARSLNARHALHGHVFGSRFHNTHVTGNDHLVGCLRYIARNPVKHGACSRPEDWPWSAHLALAGVAAAPQFLDVATTLSYLAGDQATARREYLRLSGQADQAVLSDLSQRQPGCWPAAAVDDFGVEVASLAAFLGVSRRTARRRLATARGRLGSVPGGTRGRLGSGPYLSAEG